MATKRIGIAVEKPMQWDVVAGMAMDAQEAKSGVMTAINEGATRWHRFPTRS
jgi:hypothetical protein